MKILLSYIFFFLSLSCLLVVGSAEILDKPKILFWATLFGISIIVVEKQLTKKKK